MAANVQQASLSIPRGKPIILGADSKIDTKSILDAKIEDEQAPINKIKDKIEIDNKKISALNELKLLLEDLKNSAENLRSSPSVINNNVFDTKKVDITSNDLNVATSYLSVNVGKDSQLGIHQIDNIIMASKKNQYASFVSSSAPVTSLTPVSGKFIPGMFKINNINVEIKDGDNLNNIRSNINNLSTQMNVIATIIKISDTNYRLGLSSINSGTNEAYTISDPDNCLSNINWIVNNPTDVSFNFNNIPMTRTSNIVNDIIEDVTFNFNKSTPPGTVITIEIKTDYTDITNSIESFLNNYNKVKQFIANQNKRDDKTFEYLKNSLLGGNVIIDRIESAIEQEMIRIVKGIVSTDSNPHPTALSNAGIDFYKSNENKDNAAVTNMVKIDNNIFTSYLTNKLIDIKNLFVLSSYSSNINFKVTKTSNALDITNFSISLDTNRGVGKEAKISYSRLNSIQTTEVFVKYHSQSIGGIISVDSGNSTLAGTNIKMKTPIDGIIVNYASASNVATTNIFISQGIAERVYNLLSDILDDKYGILNTAFKEIMDEINYDTDEVKDLEKKLEETKNSFILKYSKMEADLAKTNTLIEMLEAMTDAANKK